MIKSFIGLAFLVAITLENLILHKKKTIPVKILDQLFFSVLMYFLFGWVTIVYSVLLAAFLVYIEYRQRDSDEPAFDYSDRIYSISAVINQLQRVNGTIIGTIMPVNHNEIKYNCKKIPLDETILSGGSLITGSTGSGKSTTLKALIKQGIDKHKFVGFFDYKGEEEILDEIKEFAESLGVRYLEFSSRACTFTYDPFKNLNETGKVEALMNTRRWSTDGADEHYKTSMQLVIQNLIKAYDTYRVQNNDQTNYIVGLYKYACGYHPQLNEREGFANLIKSLEILLSSKAKELFGDEPTFSFEEDVPYVICFSFTSANKALANTISSFVYTDIMDRGTRRHYQNKFLLCIDEFGTLESSIIIKDLLEKGRSGGVQTIFSVLDINQIAMNTGDHFVNAILGTINNYIIHAGATQNTANLLAGVQKYDKGYDIMSLRKPYKGKKPTALFISKYPIFTKRNNQEVYRIIPYTKNLTKFSNPISFFGSNKAIGEEDEDPNKLTIIESTHTTNVEQPVDVELPEFENEEDIFSKPIKDIEKYL